MKNCIKIFLAACLLTVFAFGVQAQSVGINATGDAPNSKAILDLSSTSKGFLPPRMTYLEKTAITSPPAGLMIWCTNCGTSGELQVYNGAAWTNLIGGAASGSVPGAPIIGTATAGNGQALVPFTAPSSNGGSTIISYTATSSPGNITRTLSQAGSGTITVTGLTNGIAYTFTVKATNANGTGAASDPSNSVTPATVPGVPTGVSATSGNTLASVSFTAPVSNGGSPITSYTATSTPGSFTGTLTQAGSGTITVTGLTNGTAYTFTVKATNAIGTGAASAASNSVTYAIIPGAPTIGTATAGNALASVSFTAPVSNGGSPITSYTATSTPGSFTGTLTQAGSGTITVTGLTPGTSYSFIVTATNAIGTGASSGASNSVTPLPPLVCGNSFTDTRDSKVYTTVQIGTQCWMAQNLDVGTRIAGAGNQNNTGTIEKYCYNDLDANCTTYGGLYQWDEMMQYTTTPGVQGICPAGWHLPTDAEWTTLISYLGDYLIAGGAMKETGTAHWITPNQGATNTSGFTALPGGYRNTTGAFQNVGISGHLWSSSEFSTTNAWWRNLLYNYAFVSNNNSTKAQGLSVRCVKD